jgi:hypothetical protein
VFHKGDDAWGSRGLEGVGICEGTEEKLLFKYIINEYNHDLKNCFSFVLF